jgi:mannose-6-phosphate isomerase-like protein (cupin superfamily)
MNVRRIVTGHRNGKAVVASDENVTPVAFGSGGAFHVLWGADAPQRFPGPGTMSEWSAAFPPVGGFRFLFFTLPPESRGNDERALSGFLADQLGDVMEASDPGMHTTATVDFEVVLSGEVTLELDDGVEVVLRPNDAVVQNGTRHRWRNRGTEPATMAVIVLGAHHDELDETNPRAG